MIFNEEVRVKGIKWVKGEELNKDIKEDRIWVKIN
jgi:hypothetical protein